MNKDKNFLLKESKSFCVYPWIHLHANPEGVTAPCCSYDFMNHPTGNTRNNTISEIINNDENKKIRLKMLNEEKVDGCRICYDQEKAGLDSIRTMVNKEYGDKHIDYILEQTKDDGYIENFKMRYFDIRFNNICNFKCRSCGSGFSTQWEQEDLKHKRPWARIVPKNDRTGLVDEILEHVDHIENAYFAGGEPFIVKEHYELLEGFIKSGRRDIHLRYNSNISVFNFKDKDLINLWKNFDKVSVFASIDHFGERAEYIRHGTDWGVVENNLKKLFTIPNVHTSMNTVFSIFNYLTIDKFYEYLCSNDLYRYDYMLYNLDHPEFLSSKSLPSNFKSRGNHAIENAINLVKDYNTDHNLTIKFLKSAKGWANSEDTWEIHKEKFIEEISYIDNIRGENFEKTFPELAELIQ